MDLIGYDEAPSARSKSEFQRGSRSDCGRHGHAGRAHFVPVSALKGDNIVHRHTSSAMPWYEGPSLLELLEALPVGKHYAQPRLPISRAARVAARSHLPRLRGTDRIGRGSRGRQNHGLPSGRSAKSSAS
jgi:sulfate adenylyltransferase subunit 1 (EFTu-like GTPase family)